jgi:hypothetical protein
MGHGHALLPRRQRVLRVLLGCACLLAWSCVAHQTATAASPATTEVTRDGVTLRLTLPRLAFPRDSLAKAHVSLINRSGGSVEFATACYGSAVRVEVRRAGGIWDAGNGLTYPETGALCMGAHVTVVQPGSVLNLVTYAVLHGGEVRAVADVSGGGTDTELMTPTLRVRIVHEPGPLAVDLSHSPRVLAMVRGVPIGPQVRLYYSEWYRCPGRSPEVAGTTFAFTGSRVTGHLFDWASKQGDRLAPGCAQPADWHVVAGVLNEPVIQVAYVPGSNPSNTMASHLDSPVVQIDSHSK